MRAPLRHDDGHSDSRPTGGRAARSDDPIADLARAKAAIRDLTEPPANGSTLGIGQTLLLSLGCAVAGAALVRSPALRRNALRLAFSGLGVGARFATQRLLAERRRQR